MSRKLMLVITTVFFILGSQFALACDGDKKDKKDDGGSETYTSTPME